MNKFFLNFFWCLFVFSAHVNAQKDGWCGTWQMEYLPGGDQVPILAELQIAVSEKYILYPARLKLSCDSFGAEYELVLVKKNSRELAISKNKYAVQEQPFGLGDWTHLLNGTFIYSKDGKGIPLLTAIRMPSGGGHTKKDTVIATGSATALKLLDFFRKADIQLKKINDTPWEGDRALPLLCPSVSPAYFGLNDTVHLQERDGWIRMPGNKKKDNDILSVSLNGKLILDQWRPHKTQQSADILLDTGLNIITLFAENFANGQSSKGKIKLVFGQQEIDLDFTSPADSGATFIVAKLYCGQSNPKAAGFDNYILSDKYKPLQKNEKLAGSIISHSPLLSFGIWDDAVEDGDSISINIDGKWLVKGLPVKKKPQFITLTLKPGPNNILFIADNLGSIPPNTTVLEIIDGKKRRSFFMEANVGERNVVRIFYDGKAGL